MFSKIIILAALFVVAADAIVHPHSGDPSALNRHLRPEEYNVVAF